MFLVGGPSYSRSLDQMRHPGTRSVVWRHAVSKIEKPHFRHLRQLGVTTHGPGLFNYPKQLVNEQLLFVTTRLRFTINTIEHFLRTMLLAEAHIEINLIIWVCRSSKCVIFTLKSNYNYKKIL